MTRPPLDDMPFNEAFNDPLYISVHTRQFKTIPVTPAAYTPFPESIKTCI